MQLQMAVAYREASSRFVRCGGVGVSELQWIVSYIVQHVSAQLPCPEGFEYPDVTAQLLGRVYATCYAQPLVQKVQPHVI